MQITTRSIVSSSILCGVLVLVGAVLFGYGATHHNGFYHGLRYMIGGCTLLGSGLVWGAVLALAWRGHVIATVYREGYRQGRKDANRALLEEGMLLSLDEVAEEMYREEDNGNGN